MMSGLRRLDFRHGKFKEILSTVPILHIGVFAIVLGLSFLFSSLIGISETWKVTLLGVGVFGIIAAYLLQLYLKYAPIIIMASTAFITYTLPTGTGSRMAVSMVLTGFFLAIWILKMILEDKKIQWINFPGGIWLTGFMVTTVISLVWSTIFRDPIVRIWSSFPFVQIASTVVMILLPCALILTINFLKSERQIRWIVTILLITAVMDLCHKYINITLPANGGGLFTMWICAITAGLALFDKSLKPWQTLGLLAILIGYVIYNFILHPDWLAGWLPGLISLSILIWNRSKKLSAIFIIWILIFVILKFDTLRYLYLREQGTSGFTRLAAWVENWQFIKNHILFGMGPAGYAAYYMTYAPFEGMATHNNYLDILSETGMIGSSLFVGFWSLFAFYGNQVRRRVKDRGDFLMAIANIAFAGTIGCIAFMAFGDWIIPFAYTQTITGFSHSVYSWILIGMIPVVDRLTRENQIA